MRTPRFHLRQDSYQSSTKRNPLMAKNNRMPLPNVNVQTCPVPVLDVRKRTGNHHSAWFMRPVLEVHSDPQDHGSESQSPLPAAVENGDVSADPLPELVNHPHLDRKHAAASQKPDPLTPTVLYKSAVRRKSPAALHCPARNADAHFSVRMRLGLQF